MPRRSALPSKAKKPARKPLPKRRADPTPTPAGKPKPSAFHDIAHLKKRVFLAAFSECGTVTQAAEQADICRRTHTNWLKDPAYAAAFEDATEMAGDSLEVEARRRAFAGSDTLLIFMLKAARPAKFRDNVHHEHDGKVTLEQLVAASRLPEHDHA